MKRFIDLHCDTLTRRRPGCAYTLNDGRSAVSLQKLRSSGQWLQLFAVFIPDRLRGTAAADYFDRRAASFHEQCAHFSDTVAPVTCCADIDAAWSSDRTAAMLTVESGAALAGRLERVRTLYDAGVRVMTLTWNGENELASGKATDHGFSGFGREAVAEMERIGIIADVSHLNDRGFAELCGFSEKPFIATHSNARVVAGCPRNLPDEFVREIVSRGGLIGINLCRMFLSGSDFHATPDDVYRHAAHLLELGAEHLLAMGGDLDGALLPRKLRSCDTYPYLADYLLSRGLSEDTVDGIMWRNAYRFFGSQLTV